MAKKDMSFIKMVDNDEDFHREVYEHGQENLLVSALPPCVRSSDACAHAWRSLSPAVVDIYTKCWGPCLMLDNYLYNTYFGALALAHHHHQAVVTQPTAGLPVADMSDAGMGVKFVRAQCDKILELSEYRDNACPHFLFYMVCTCNTA